MSQNPEEKRRELVGLLKGLEEGFEKKVSGDIIAEGRFQDNAEYYKRLVESMGDGIRVKIDYFVRGDEYDIIVEHLLLINRHKSP